MKNFTLYLFIFFLTTSSVYAQCDNGEDLIDEDFESYTAGSTIPTCWTNLDAGGMISGIRNTADNANSGTQYILHYTFFSSNTSYIIVPKLNTIDGGHEADFFIKTANINGTFEIGTMSNASDSSTFTRIGATNRPLTETYQQVNSGAIADNGDEYFAIKFMTPDLHTAFYIDDFKWQESIPLSIDDNTTSIFEFYPNPAKDKIVHLSFLNAWKEKEIEIYNLNGQRVFNKKTANSEETLDLNNLSNGLYLLKVIQNNSVTNKKLILGT
ncbi:MAG: T9SS type A sorting domain-containing protein [Flavobacteriaceae bacterium]|nr:T9SS type A sorting domain-containing protein [Flavobacteriaceae bacterium]